MLKEKLSWMWHVIKCKNQQSSVFISIMTSDMVIHTVSWILEECLEDVVILLQ